MMLLAGCLACAPVWEPASLTPVSMESTGATKTSPPLDSSAGWSGWVRAYCSDIPEGLVWSVMEVESGFNPRAVSRSGAIGLMQVMPFHARREEDLFDPATNIRVGCRVLREAYARAVSSPYRWHREHPWRTALAVYNAGWTGAIRRGQGWNYAQMVLGLACRKYRVCLR